MRSDEFWAILGTHARNFFTNWRDYDASFPAKLALTFRNRLKATFSTQQCCGHRGEPGC